MLMLSVQGRVRSAREEDAERLAEVFRASWLDAYRAIIPAQDLELLVNKRGVSWWRRALRAKRDFVVVEAGGVVAGYAMIGRARGPSLQRGSDQGEILEIYLCPEYQGHGLGELLFEGCRARLDLRGYKGLTVWALNDNALAIAFYWNRGGRVFARRWERVGDAMLLKAAMIWD